MGEPGVSATASSQIAGRYILHGEIASGGMATVFLGRFLGDAGFSRIVAIKRLHEHLAKDPAFVAMFLDEARLAARIRHPNVVPTIDVCFAHNNLMLVMEYIHGESLSRISRGLRESGERIPLPIVAAILSGVLQGLHAAHEATDEREIPLRIVHRDVSPQNVLVGADGVARVVDFGVAKAVNRLQTTRGDELKGKLAYFAPEQVEGTGVDRRTDVCAAAILLWEALTLQRLYRGENEGEILGKVVKGCQVPPSHAAPGTPADLDRVVMRGLAVRKEDRFQTAAEMADAIEECVPVATNKAVSTWIGRVAAEVLSERAERISRLESGMVMSVPEVIVPIDVASASRPSLSTVARSSRRPALRTEGKYRSLFVAVPVVAVAIAGVVAVVAFHRFGSGAGTPLPASSDPPAEAPRLPSSAEAKPQEGAASPTAMTATAELPTAPSAAPASIAARAISAPEGLPFAAGVTVRNLAPKAEGSPPTGMASTPAPLPPSPQRIVHCNPPYWLDEQGNKIYKRECM
jgi:eukaryotic-like serine/threonine-protein kinase